MPVPGTAIAQDTGTWHAHSSRSWYPNGVRPVLLARGEDVRKLGSEWQRSHLGTDDWCTTPNDRAVTGLWYELRETPRPFGARYAETHSPDTRELLEAYEPPRRKIKDNPQA